MSPITLVGIPIDHRFTQGDDLTEIILTAIDNSTDIPGGLHNGDIVVVTSKIIAKVEGRVIQAEDREDAITSETVRVVATKEQPRGVTRIVETSHGLILAAAGVDASNTESGTVVLLPRDPDASARQLREQIMQLRSVNAGVIITDTLGRAWRLGVTDHAIGAAGVQVLDNLTGTKDSFGQELHMTVVAVADQLAAASELVRAKQTLTPVAVIRGASQWVNEFNDTGTASARDLIRSSEEDLFSLGTAESIALGARGAVYQRRTIRNFTSDPVPREVIEAAIQAAASAPAPHHTTPWRFRVFTAGVDDSERIALLDAMREKWKSDLTAEGRTESEIAKRVKRGDLLRTAPVVVFAFIDMSAGAHTYPEPLERNVSELNMFHIAGGAAVENLLISIATSGYGSAWISSSIFCPHTMRSVLGLTNSYWPLGGIAIGVPANPPQERAGIDIQNLLIQ
jgi:coenzyme F420-0:L-glutamate ligase/coenzyme F420-1:gamma-L-glutamate ligase